MNILITGGGCEEPIDGVRSIGNFSTGMTSALIAKTFAQAGHQVTAIFSKKSLSTEEVTHNLSKIAYAHKIEIKAFQSFANLSKLLTKKLRNTNYDFIIHAAAVSDYGIDSIEVGGKKITNTEAKIESNQSISIHLKPHPKLIDSIKNISSNPKTKLIAFKLTNTKKRKTREDAVNELFQHSKADFVVSNDLSEITETKHSFSVYTQDKNTRQKKPCIMYKGNTKKTLASFLLSLTNEGDKI